MNHHTKEEIPHAEGAEAKAVEKSAPRFPEAGFVQKRKARIDMHTLLEGEQVKIDVKSMAMEELMALKSAKDISNATRSEVEKELKKRLDPEDQDTVEV